MAVNRRRCHHRPLFHRNRDWHTGREGEVKDWEIEELGENEEVENMGFMLYKQAEWNDSFLAKFKPLSGLP